MTRSPSSTPPTGHPVIRAVHLPVVDINRPRRLPATMHTTLVAVDISGFCARRDATIQMHLRERMYRNLLDAFTMTGISWWDCHREDRGDGALIVAPPDINADLFLDPLAHHLKAVLRRDNRHANEVTRLRIRMAVHHGDVHRDSKGVAGVAVNHLFRLLDSAAFKKAFQAADDDLAMIVSKQLYADAVHRGGHIDVAAYRQLRITCKETRGERAWMWLPPTRL
jgi:hypothetical protein